MQKYGSKKVTYDGIVFDSKKEMRRYCELKLLERAGKIKDLELQKTFELIPAQYESIILNEVYTKGDKKGLRKKKRFVLKKPLHTKQTFITTTSENILMLLRIQKVSERKIM